MLLPCVGNTLEGASALFRSVSIIISSFLIVLSAVKEKVFSVYGSCGVWFMQSDLFSKLLVLTSICFYFTHFWCTWRFANIRPSYAFQLCFIVIFYIGPFFNRSLLVYLVLVMVNASIIYFLYLFIWSENMSK